MNEYLIMSINVFIVAVGIAVIKKVVNNPVEGMEKHYLTIKDHRELCYAAKQETIQLVKAIISPMEAKLDMIYEDLKTIKQNLNERRN